MQETGSITAHGYLNGNKLYQQRARKALPLLVRQAKARQKIFYSDLAEELNIPNPRNLNYVLGTIGNAIEKLGTKRNTEIPPIQCLVVNKHTGIPGEGVGWFIQDRKQFNKCDMRTKRLMIDRELFKIFSYNSWDDVLKEFDLKSVNTTPIQSLETPSDRYGNAGGESEEHKQFKKFIAEHPDIVGLPSCIENGTEEYAFPSGDALDVLFRNGEEKIGVEVKAKKSDISDILRGLFQCVKYQALLEALQMVEQKRVDARVILVLEGKFPKELLSIKNILGVEILDLIHRIP